MISYISVNHNSSDKLIRAVKSFGSSLSGHEFIIVDNSDNDLEFQKISTLKNSQIQILKMKNMGFGAACNLACKSAQGNLLVFVNPDVIIKTNNISDWILKKSADTVSFFSPSLRYLDERPQPTGQSYSNLFSFILQTLRLGALARSLGLLPLIKKFLSVLGINSALIESYNLSVSSNENRKCDWVSGAFLVCRKEDFLSIQGFDENFFLYSEDEDLCRRLARGKRSQGMIFSDAVVYHEVGGTQRKGSFSRADVEKFRSRMIYLQKYDGSLSAAAYMGFSCLLNILLLAIDLLFFDKPSIKNRALLFKVLARSYRSEYEQFQ